MEDEKLELYKNLWRLKSNWKSLLFLEVLALVIGWLISTQINISYIEIRKFIFSGTIDGSVVYDPASLTYELKNNLRQDVSCKDTSRIELKAQPGGYLELAMASEAAQFPTTQECIAEVSKVIFDTASKLLEAASNKKYVRDDLFERIVRNLDTEDPIEERSLDVDYPRFAVERITHTDSLSMSGRIRIFVSALLAGAIIWLLVFCRFFTNYVRAMFDRKYNIV